MRALPAAYAVAFIPCLSSRPWRSSWFVAASPDAANGVGIFFAVEAKDLAETPAAAAAAARRLFDRRTLFAIGTDEDAGAG